MSSSIGERPGHENPSTGGGGFDEMYSMFLTLANRAYRGI